MGLLKVYGGSEHLQVLCRTGSFK